MWIDESKGAVGSVCIGIDTGVQPERVALKVLPDGRIVVSEVVQMQSGPPIEDLARQYFDAGVS